VAGRSSDVASGGTVRHNSTCGRHMRPQSGLPRMASAPGHTHPYLWHFARKLYRGVHTARIIARGCLPCSLTSLPSSPPPPPPSPPIAAPPLDMLACMRVLACVHMYTSMCVRMCVCCDLQCGIIQWNSPRAVPLFGHPKPQQA